MTQGVLVVHKFCPHCKADKPVSEFHKDRRAATGYQVYCKVCKTEMQRNSPTRKLVVDKYRKANKEICNARSIASMKKNREYYSKKSMEWQQANHEHWLNLRRKNYAKNSSREIERVRRRQGRIKGQMQLTAGHQAEIDGMYLFCQIFKGFEVDHKIPLNGKRVSGLHIPENLQVLSKRENRSKGNRFD
jgi:transcription elongation factor Elf1